MDDPAVLTIAANADLPSGAPVLARLGLPPGGMIVLDLLPRGRVQVRAPAGIEAFFGCPSYDGPAVSLDTMQDAIMAAAAGEPLGWRALNGGARSGGTGTG